MTLHPAAFASESLLSAEWQYSNITGEAFGILHGLKEVHNYCFAKEVHVMSDHKMLVAIVNKGDTSLSQWLQCIRLCIHQYGLQILYKSGPEFYGADRLSHNNYAEKRDQEIMGRMLTYIPLIQQ